MNDETQEVISGGVIGLDKIMAMIPHRYPFLLIDRVLSWELSPTRKVTAIKNVTINEPFFQGHFPDNPVMPGVLVIEAMAQAAGIIGSLSRESGSEEAHLYYLVKVDKAKFSRMVVPGDQLVMEVTEKRRMRNMGIFLCSSTVEGKKVASCEIMCAGRQ